MVAVFNKVLFIAITVLAWIWNAPQVLIGLILSSFLLPYAGEFKNGRLYIYVNQIVGYANTSGQTWGRVHFFRFDPPNAELEVHELNHGRYCDILGPFWIPVYLGAGIVAVLKGGNFYFDNWFELTARQISGDPS